MTTPSQPPPNPPNPPNQISPAQVTPSVQTPAPAPEPLRFYDMDASRIELEIINAGSISNPQPVARLTAYTGTVTDPAIVDLAEDDAMALAEHIAAGFSAAAQETALRPK